LIGKFSASLVALQGVWVSVALMSGSRVKKEIQKCCGKRCKRNIARKNERIPPI